MADKITGKIQYLNEKPSKDGKYTMYSIKVDGTNYGIGRFAPRGVEQGDTVEFEVEYNGNWPNVAKGTLRKVEAAPAAAPPAAKSDAAAPAKAAWAGGRNADTQDIISKQAALNTALGFLEFALKNETLPVPKAKNAGYGYLKTLWLKEAAELYELNTGKVWELPEADVEADAPKPVKKAAAKKAAAKPEPEDVDEEFDDSIDDIDWA